MSFQVALSGLNAASTDLQVTSNNIANANTTGFKSSRAEFADVFSGEATGIGAGVRLTDVRQEFTQGNVEITERQLDLAISGNGFFIVNDGGGLLYSRVGAFGLNATGFVENAEGERLQVYPGAGGRQLQHRYAERPADHHRHQPAAAEHAGRHEHQPAGRRGLAGRRALRPERPADLQPQHLDGGLRLAGRRAHGDLLLLETGGAWEVYQTLDGNTIGGAQPFTFAFRRQHRRRRPTVWSPTRPGIRATAPTR